MTYNGNTCWLHIKYTLYFCATSTSSSIWRAARTTSCMYVYSIILYICLAFLTVYPPIHHQYVMRISRNKNKMGCLHHRPDALLAQNHPCICIYIAITLIHRIRVEKYIGVQRYGIWGWLFNLYRNHRTQQSTTDILYSRGYTYSTINEDVDKSAKLCCIFT